MYETMRLAIGLRMARAACQWTQQELADMMGVTKNVIARNEKSDMTMRADTLVKLIYTLNKRGVVLDIFSTQDNISLNMVGSDLDAAAMRIARAVLIINQQEMADYLGLTKAIITRGERPKACMTTDTWNTFKTKMEELGILIEWVSSSNINVLVTRPVINFLVDDKSQSV